jgi:hypothetical protein
MASLSLYSPLSIASLEMTSRPFKLERGGLLSGFEWAAHWKPAAEALAFAV